MLDVRGDDLTLPTLAATVDELAVPPTITFVRGRVVRGIGDMTVLD